MVILHTLSLITRTLLSIYVSTLDGEIVKNIVERNLSAFTYSVCIGMLGVVVVISLTANCRSYSVCIGMLGVVVVFSLTANCRSLSGS